MMHRRRFLATAATAAAGATLAAPAVWGQSRQTIKIGLAPQQATQAETRKVWEPIYRIVADRMGVGLDLTVANDWAGISVALASEQIDATQMGPWGYVLARAKGEARIACTMLVNGEPTYRAVIVARPGLKIDNWPEGARGLSMQMLDVGSTTGWMVPTHWFRQRGLEPKTFFGRYAEGASAAAAQVAAANGQVDLATGWDIHRNTMIRNGTIKPDSNTVVWQSDPLPNEVVAVRRSFPEEMRVALRDALVGLTDEQKKLLPWPYTGFVPGEHKPYEVLEKMGRDLGVLKAS
ncbi:phosphate/phosphite/phosphonate ABC transporter substrate-binding protein [Rhodoplanes sp. TEM]|uniref:Phosphate/phosphite/phosphonate ABC transporter substrate-binding protein n=1 Tax=Rhodoplanes tepidamans TaxID=200616 RepID=A0ABT5JFF0_RHOTP|nr:MULTISPECIES: phosphate/phosphite/phosphonate ABC transporter substrate-binding protein [Rhodoplanes]MDC7788342.1 phosphate/phosphite/phosphonate ABC transporter substrate-binding protein [Rhodoplanes tepidamans]MDC7986084.1 phosphate/phosphite/phosphonate ABC transporter substrate-binding protein [Rhodoplanes sp. TEM]MDQ0358823.1 phosphonate transport system substrate-binding protein [Rhodoplanes tepidamans]